MSSKSWNYKEVTIKAIEKIMALKEGAKTRNEWSKKAYNDWAYGVYLGWEAITIGHQKEGDDEYIRNLANSVGK